MAEILVVDDEAAIADLVEVCLKNEGYTVYKCGSGETALTCVARQHLDLAILDVMLPDLDGFTLCQKIREEHLFPILMLTARVEDMDKIMGLTLLLLTYRISVMAMAYSLILSSLLSQLINTWPNRKLLDYRYLEQLKDILPSILLAVFMGCCMWLVNLAHLPNIVTLVIQILIGAAVYLGGSALLKLDTFEYLWNVVKPKIQRKPWADNED